MLRRGRRHGGELVVVHVRRRDDADPARVTAVASRRVGGAVQRNRAKRVLRAAAAAVRIAPGVDVALVARRATPQASAVAVAEELRDLFPAGIAARTSEQVGS